MNFLLILRLKKLWDLQAFCLIPLPTAEDDLECPLNGKLSESSGYASSDLYDYEAFCNDDSDVGFPTDNHASEANSNLLFNSQSVKD